MEGDDSQGARHPRAVRTVERALSSGARRSPRPAGSPRLRPHARAQAPPDAGDAPAGSATRDGWASRSSGGPRRPAAAKGCGRDGTGRMKNGGARLLVIGAAVVVGILVLAKGFQGSAGDRPRAGALAVPQQPHPRPAPAARTSPGGAGGNAGEPPAPAAGRAGRASTTRPTPTAWQAAAYNELKAKGYVLAGELGNLPPADQHRHLLQGRPGQGRRAATSRTLAVPEAKIKKLPKNLPAGGLDPQERRAGPRARQRLRAGAPGLGLTAAVARPVTTLTIPCASPCSRRCGWPFRPRATAGSSSSSAS